VKLVSFYINFLILKITNDALSTVEIIVNGGKIRILNENTVTCYEILSWNLLRIRKVNHEISGSIV
jgi:hypothetical protein